MHLLVHKEEKPYVEIFDNNDFKSLFPTYAKEHPFPDPEHSSISRKLEKLGITGPFEPVGDMDISSIPVMHDLRIADGEMYLEKCTYCRVTEYRLRACEQKDRIRSHQELEVVLKKEAIMFEIVGLPYGRMFDIIANNRKLIGLTH